MDGADHVLCAWLWLVSKEGRPTATAPWPRDCPPSFPLLIKLRMKIDEGGEDGWHVATNREWLRAHERSLISGAQVFREI